MLKNLVFSGLFLTSFLAHSVEQSNHTIPFILSGDMIDTAFFGHKKNLDHYVFKSGLKWDKNGCVIHTKNLIEISHIDAFSHADVPQKFIDVVTLFNDEFIRKKRTHDHIETLTKVKTLYDLLKNNQFHHTHHQALLPYKVYLREYHHDQLCLDHPQAYSSTIVSELTLLSQTGYQPAMLWLSLAYEYGIGHRVDLIEAYAWRAVSVAMDRPHGQNRLDQLSKQLSPTQLNQAEALAFEYMKQFTNLFDSPTTVILQ